MDYSKEIFDQKILIEKQSQQIQMMQISIDILGGKIDNNTSDILNLINTIKNIIPVIGSTTYQMFTSNVITSISIDSSLFDLKKNDIIIVYDLYLNNSTQFVVDANSYAGSNNITVVSNTLSNNITANSLVLFKMIRDNASHSIKIDS
jgi:hypothetical protein